MACVPRPSIAETQEVDSIVFVLECVEFKWRKWEQMIEGYLYCPRCGSELHADFNAARNIIEVQQASTVAGTTGTSCPRLSELQSTVCVVLLLSWHDEQKEPSQMQIPIDVTVTISIVASLLSMLLSIELILIWRSYENRLLTDLPLLFGLSFIFQGANMLMQTLVLAGVFPDTLDFLRVRACVIYFVMTPPLPGLLQIWAHKYKRYHSRVLLAYTVYWFVVVVLAPSAVVLMGLLYPIMMIPGIGFIITFAITWRTGRLKEIRSDLALLGLVVIIVSQSLKIPLRPLGLSFVSDILNAIGIFVGGLAFILPRMAGTVSTKAIPAEDTAPIIT